MYRTPATPPPPTPTPELDEYEAKLRRSARRKRFAFVAVVATMGVLGVGSCFGPVVVAVGSDVWNSHKTHLTAEEAKEVDGLLGPIELEAKASQAAFVTVWPKLRAGEIGARRDLGQCPVRIPGPEINRDDVSEDSTSLERSSEGQGWTFIDLSPETARSPIATVKMPRGSMALNNTGTGDRYVFPPQPLRVASADTVPTLDSTAYAASTNTWREEGSGGIRRDGHEPFLYRVRSYAKYAPDVDVIVFVDRWLDPKVSDEKPPTPRDDLEALEHGDRPTRLFDPGLALARAFAWSPKEKKVVCASQAVAESSQGIVFRSDNLDPLRQDLVLQLERALERNFVASGDAPPKLDLPDVDAERDDGQGDDRDDDDPTAHAPPVARPRTHR